MSNNYFISPIGFSDSIYLTYDNSQPFASFGLKKLGSGQLSMSLPSAPPEDGQPRSLITEYLMLDSDGAIGSNLLTYHSGPLSRDRKRHQSDPRSQYHAYHIDDKTMRWNHTDVTWDGRTLPMIYCSAQAPLPHRLPTNNNQATALMHARRQALIERGARPNEIWNLSDCIVYNDAYIALKQMWKPYVDIPVANYKNRLHFIRQARPFFGKRWWHVTWIDREFRLYADDMNDLFYAKLVLHK
jgi:hypothetical protein